MRPCDVVLDRLDEAIAGTLPEELARHVAECADCRLAVERTRGLAEGEKVLRSVHAPEALRARLRALARLTPACEQAIEWLGAALDGELPNDDRAALMEHMHSCARCQAVFEAFATLRDVGAGTAAPSRLRATARLHPRHRLEMRQRRGRFFDLRLATAAVYLLAALTVMMLSNPSTVARASTDGMDRAATYATAAVENRISSYSRRLAEGATAVQGWLRDRAEESWQSARSMFGGKSANPKGKKTVEKDGGEK
jgi:hypothetical protein